MSEKRLRSGLLVFPDMTQLDLTGPYEVLARLPGAETLLLWKTLDPVRSEHGLTILPTATLESSGPLDLRAPAAALDVLRAAQPYVIQQAELVGTYRR